MEVPRIHPVPNVEPNGFISIKSTKRVSFRGMVSNSKVSYHLQNVPVPWRLSGKEFACQCRRHGFDSLVWEDPTCQDAAKLGHHNSKAQDPQLLKSMSSPMLHNKSDHSEKPANCS